MVPRWALLGLLVAAVASGGCRQGPWSLWSAYADRFIDVQGRVIDHSAADHSTSEGQSYALFFALADNDRARFDRVLAWTENNLAGGSLSAHLPGWLWGKSPSGEWKLLDPNPASDADCWMAYSLLEAGRLWNNPAYTTLGRQMMSMIAKQEVADLPGFGAMLMPGTTALFVHGSTWTVNPSYVPLFLFQRFDEVDPAGPWGAIALNVPRMLRQSARHGFAMDWVDYQPGDDFAPAPAPGSAVSVASDAPNATPNAALATAAAPAANAPNAPNAPDASANVPAPQPPATSVAASSSPADPPAQPAAPPRPPMGSYDAIRVYLWAGMTNAGDGVRTELIAALPAMGNYVSQMGVPPEHVNADGTPEPHPGPIGFSAALLPYLWAVPDLARAASQQRIRMSHELNPATGLYGKQPAYYDQNLVLFATGYLDGRFQFGSHGELKVEWRR